MSLSLVINGTIRAGRDASAASQILRRLNGESESNREIKKLLEALRD